LVSEGYRNRFFRWFVASVVGDCVLAGQLIEDLLEDALAKMK